MKRLVTIVLILIPLTSSILAHSDLPKEIKMNACGVSFELSESVFEDKFQRTMIDAMYQVDIITKDGKINQVHCVMSMNNINDTYYVYSNTACYIYKFQEGITQVTETENSYTYTIGTVGLVKITLIGNEVNLLFVKN